MKRSDLQVTKFTNSSPYYSVTLVHMPTGLSVFKAKCLSRFRDEEPLYEQLRDKVNDHYNGDCDKKEQKEQYNGHKF